MHTATNQAAEAPAQHKKLKSETKLEASVEESKKKDAAAVEARHHAHLVRRLEHRVEKARALASKHRERQDYPSACAIEKNALRVL